MAVRLPPQNGHNEYESLDVSLDRGLDGDDGLGPAPAPAATAGSKKPAPSRKKKVRACATSGCLFLWRSRRPNCHRAMCHVPCAMCHDFPRPVVVISTLRKATMQYRS